MEDGVIVEHREIKTKYGPRKGQQHRTYQNNERKPVQEPMKENPIEAAQRAFGRGLTIRENNYGLKVYHLHGLPICLHDLMRETNRVRVKWGIDQITYCKDWIV